MTFTCVYVGLNLSEGCKVLRLMCLFFFLCRSASEGGSRATGVSACWGGRAGVDERGRGTA